MYITFIEESDLPNGKTEYITTENHLSLRIKITSSQTVIKGNTNYEKIKHRTSYKKIGFQHFYKRA